jgi:NAD(P)-dependent dehydrogenase (short-subunit alcohol dehydrogenase family)
MDLHRKVAVVTGAGSGIGAAVATRFLQAGAAVIGVDLRGPALPPEVEALHAGRWRGLVGDVAEEATAREFVRASLDAFGRLDVVVNNAGVAVVKPIHEHTPEEWERVLGVNVKSIYWAARHAIPVMRRQGGGVILNTASISGVVGIPGQGAYAASKGAVVQLTRQMAVEYARDGIRVNAIGPGTVDTPLLRQAAADSDNPEAFLQGLRDGHPVGRIADVAEIAPLYLFLASDEARFITGAVIMIDGGYTAR